ncbi:MAG TPA: hypothetical protein EYP85_02170 [Armatimonadetes bacterium]|nr:hypothetical protein [Armatimonadota bacterium]
MNNVLTLCRKELKTYFVSAVGYVVLFIFISIASYLFLQICRLVREADMRILFQNINVTFLFVVPLITMRLFAEEKGSGTIELLMTSPVREVELVIGKFLAAIVLLLVMIAVTLEYPLFLLAYGDPDLGPIITGYIGLFLIGASFISLGIFLSTLTRSQIVAAVSTFGVLLAFWLIGIAAENLSGNVGEVFRYLSVLEHLEDLQRGVIDAKDIVFFVTLIGFFLYCSIVSLASSKWR